MPWVRAAGRSLHYEWFGRDEGGPALVFLHEGLGSIAQWRDFPAEVAEATGCRALVYERYGYGRSEVLEEARRTVRFMHDEALAALPELLASLRIGNPVLIGHSDGASIALIHAGAGFPVRGVVALAPHVFVEPVCLKAIAEAKRAFEATDLPRRLGRYHLDASKTFYGWADVWLDPEFERWDIRDGLRNIRCPVLAIQGRDDEYGTMAQLEEIERCVPGSCRRLELERCGHTPFRDRAEETLSAVCGFIRRI